MANGKHGDNPLTDMLIHGEHPFPDDLEQLMRRAESLYKYALGQHWPFGPREFDWAAGRHLDTARRDMRREVELLEADRAAEILLDPLTGRPLAESSFVPLALPVIGVRA